MDTVKKFYAALQADKAMQERANSLNESYKGTDPAAIDQKAAAAEIVAFAKGEGYDFTATELEEYQKGMRALDDEELDAVAGGLFTGTTCYCVFGGSGEDYATGAKCICGINGSGNADERGQSLSCEFTGTIGYNSY